MRSIFIIALLAGYCFAWNTSSAQNFNEILGRPTASSVTISILCDQQTEVYWEYGSAPATYSASTAISLALKDTALEAGITGLAADAKYYYRTRYRPRGATGSFLAGPERTFHTQRAKGSTFTFTIESDEHLCDKKGVRSIFRICLDNQAKDNPDFMFSLGDNFGGDHNPLDITSQEVDSLHKMYRPFWGNICHSVPLFICLGNHEGENDFYLAKNPPENIAVYSTLWRKFYYPNPYPDDFYSGNTDVEPYGIGNPENYYAFTWGDALFVVLDVYRNQCDSSAKPKNWDWSLGLPQYTWLKNTLESSTAKYKFVFAHHTRGEGRGGINTARYFEWGGYEADGLTWGFSAKRPGWEKPIHQLFVDNGVNIFFQGHDHLFAHEELDGVIYQEVPMPSDSTYEIGMLANAGAYVSDTLNGSGHLRVSVSPTCVKADYIRAYLPADTLDGVHYNRELAFSYTIGTCQSGISDQAEKASVIVYPNPAQNRINVKISGETGPFQLGIFNTLGLPLLQTQSGYIDVGSIRNGIYFLHIRTSNSEVTKKIIINR